MRLFSGRSKRLRPSRADTLKLSVVALAGLVGVYLGVLGYHAPRLNAGSLVAAAPGAVSGGPGGAASPGRPAGGGGSPAAAAGTNGTGNGGGATRTGTAGTTGHTGTAGATGGTSAAAATGRHASTATAAAGAKTAAATGGGTAAATGGKTAPPGPLLSSTRWWPFAHQVYPSQPSPSTNAALTGFHVSFSKAAAGLERVQVATGRGKPQSATFRRTDRLYMIEGGMGDDSFSMDTNFGDDAFVLTDAGGHIVGK